MWEEDGELWLLRNLVEWGSHSTESQREKVQMNKDLVAGMQFHFRIDVDGKCVKNKQQDLEVSFNFNKRARKNISGLGWCDSQVVWDPAVWEEFKLQHPEMASNLEAHQRLYTSEKYKQMSTLFNGRTKAIGKYR